MIGKYSKLRVARERLNECYHFEFLRNLSIQATNKKHRYAPTKHKKLGVGDIVLLIENNTKRYNYPLARVVEIEENENCEVTAAKVRK